MWSHTHCKARHIATAHFFCACTKLIFYQFYDLETLPVVSFRSVSKNLVWPYCNYSGRVGNVIFALEDTMKNLLQLSTHSQDPTCSDNRLPIVFASNCGLANSHCKMATLALLWVSHRPFHQAWSLSPQPFLGHPRIPRICSCGLSRDPNLMTLESALGLVQC